MPGFRPNEGNQLGRRIPHSDCGVVGTLGRLGADMLGVDRAGKDGREQLRQTKKRKKSNNNPSKSQRNHDQLRLGVKGGGVVVGGAAAVLAGIDALVGGASEAGLATKAGCTGVEIDLRKK